MNLVIYILILIGTVSITLALFRSEKECPPQKIEYRYLPNYELNVMYSEENRPSKVFSDMFKKSSIWIGSSELGIGKTVSPEEQKIKDEQYSKLQNQIIV
jgi:hypothetical protein